MKKIVVTGASGFIGSYLCKNLDQDKNIQLYAMKRKAGGPILNHGKNVILDLSSDKLEQCLIDIRPDIIFHTAALSQVDYCEINQNEAWNINVLATEKIARTAQEIGARMIFLSSDFVFSGQNEFETEESDYSPVSYYGETKVAAELAIKKLMTNYAIVRPVLVYGIPLNQGRNNIVTMIKQNLESGNCLNIVTDQFRTPIYVKDLIVLLIQLGLSAEKGIFHAGGLEYISIFDFAQKIARAYGFDARLLSPVNSLQLSQKGVRPPKTHFTSTKAHRIFPFFTRNIDQGLIDIINNNTDAR